MNATSSEPNQWRGKDPDSEAAWVAGAKAGYTLCFEELVHRNEGKIFGLALRITQNREDAEDILQKTFRQAYLRLDQFRGDSSFYAWLVRIAVSKALMKLPKGGPSQVALDEPMASEEDLMPREVEDWGPTPEQRYARTELQQIISDAIGKLDLAYRIVFLLRDMENLTNEETAQLLELSVPAVKSRLLRARLKMRSNLNPYFSLA